MLPHKDLPVDRRAPPCGGTDLAPGPVKTQRENTGLSSSDGMRRSVGVREDFRERKTEKHLKASGNEGHFVGLLRELEHSRQRERLL